MRDTAFFRTNYSINKKPLRTDQILSSYLIRLQAEGYCEVRLNGTFYPLAPGDLLLGRPGDRYQLTIGQETDRSIRSGDYYLFSLSRWIEEWWREGPPPHVRIGLDEQLLHIWKTLIYEKRKGADADADIQDSLIRLLCLSIRRMLRQGAAVGRGPGYTPYRIKSFVERNATRKFTLQEAAGSAGLGISRASQLFKETFGQSIMDYAVEVRLAMAKDQIAYDNTSLEEVAYACGFATYAYFSRAFRARFGVTPSEFKRLNREGQG